MKPAPFAYQRAASVDEAVSHVSSGDGVKKFLAGGQSLAPMMNLRLVRVDELCDLSYVSELHEVSESGTSVFFGGGVTHAAIEDGETPDPIAGMMREVASGIAYRAVRNRGTIGGSIAHADPAADWVIALTAMNASIHLTGDSGNRTVPMTAYMIGAYTTVMSDSEIITKVEVPKYSDDSLWGYYKICRKVGEFADAMAAVVIDPEKKYCRVVLGATGGAPIVLNTTSKALAEHGVDVAFASLSDTLVSAIPSRDSVQHQLDRTTVERAVSMAMGRAQ